MEVIKISQLNAKYNEHLAIKNINLNINSHEYLCLVGKKRFWKKHTIKSHYWTNKKKILEI